MKADTAVNTAKLTGDPAGELSIDTRSFGASFQAFMERMAAQSPGEEPEFRRRLREHFGIDPATLPVVTERFATHEQVNLHLALQVTLAAPEWAVEVLGTTSPAWAATPSGCANS